MLKPWGLAVYSGLPPYAGGLQALSNASASSVKFLTVTSA
jgi:hypothetical protein